MNPLPPRWPGIVMIIAGVIGLVFVASPRAAGIALVIVVCWMLLMLALGALVAASRADDRLERISPYDLEERASEYAQECIDQIRRDEAEISAAAVIADHSFPARGSATQPQRKGGDQGSASDTATPGANLRG